MATHHLLNEDDFRKRNLCNGRWDGRGKTDINKCDCPACLLKVLNDALIKIDSLEDDLMVANRTIGILSRYNED